MFYTVGVVLLVFGVAIITGAVLQVLQYRRGEQLISRQQLIWRLVTAVLLLSTIVCIFLGVLHPWPSPLSELVFWSFLTVLAVIVIFLAFQDLREVDRQKHLKQSEIYRAMQKLQDDTSPKGKS